jgi:hypothetical protein
VAGLAIINAIGVYAQLVAPHVGERGTALAGLETQDGALAARIEVATHNVSDLDRRLGQIDSAIEEAAKRGKTNTALSAMEAQRRARAGLTSERNEAAATLAALKAERAIVVAKGRQIETEAAPIRYVAELIGADTDGERAIRWLILMMVLCCDPLAMHRLRLRRGDPLSKATLVRSALDSCRGDAIEWHSGCGSRLCENSI